MGGVILGAGTSFDVIEQLEAALAKEPLRPGTADSDVNVMLVDVAVPQDVVVAAIAELKTLRAFAGAVSQGPLFQELKEHARQGTRPET